MNQNITLTSNNKSVTKVVHAVQKDTGRVLNVTLDREDLTSSMTYNAVIEKPSGLSCYIPATFDSVSKVISVELTNQALAEEGNAKAQIEVTDTAGRVTSYFFYLAVEKALRDDETIESSNEFTALQAMGNSIAQAKAEFDNAIRAVSSDTEVTDIRVKEDGTTASTAGNAVREQVGAVYNEIGGAIDNMIGKKAFYHLPYTKGMFIDRQTGAERADAGWEASDYVEIGNLRHNKLVTSSTMQASYNIYNAFYNASKQYISSFTLGEEITIPTGAVYFRTSKEITATTTINPYIPQLVDEQRFALATNQINNINLKVADLEEFAETTEADVMTLKEDLTQLAESISNITNMPEIKNYIDLSNFVNVDTSIVPTISTDGDEVTITQPSRANVKVAFPITVPDIESEYEILIDSNIVLNTNARILITIGSSSGNQGTATQPVPTTSDYKRWNVSGYFTETSQKYLYILLPYNIPSATFTISIKKKLPEQLVIKNEALVDISKNNLNTELKHKVETVDYLESRVGADLSGRTLVILNFEQPCSDWYEDRQHLLESYGFKGSFALTEDITQGDIPRLHDLVNKGHDISIYTQTTNGRPSDMNDVSKQSEWDAYVDVALNVAKRYGIVKPTAYHCKYNQIGDALYNSIVSRGFKIARCSNVTKSEWNLDGTNYIKSFDRITTVVNTTGLSSTAQSGGFIYWVNKAIENHWDLSIFGHGMEDVDADTPTQDNVKFKKYVLVEILEHLKACEQQGTIAVVTWEEYVRIRSGN